MDIDQKNLYTSLYKTKITTENKEILYNAYKKCTECSKSNKCFGLTAGPEGNGYGCIPCTGSQTKANCLAPPDEGGAGCPGISIYDKIPLNPETNNNRVCKRIPY